MTLLRHCVPLAGLSLASGVVCADAVALEFRVRAVDAESSSSCAASAALTCCDDLSLAEVFNALRSMAEGRTPMIFPIESRKLPVAGVNVLLGPCTDRIQTAFRIIKRDYIGKYGHLHMSGAGADKTILSGRAVVPATAWQAVPDEASRINPGAPEFNRVALPGGALPMTLRSNSSASGFGWPVRPFALDVFSGAMPLEIARWPNEGRTEVDDSASIKPLSRRLPLRGDRSHSWRPEPQLVAARYVSNDWAFERIPVVRIDAGGALTLQGEGAQFGVRAGHSVEIENALVELDRPGERYFDVATHVLYLWPLSSLDGRNDRAPADIELSVAVGLLCSEESRHLSIGGLTLQHSRGDELVIENFTDNDIIDSAIRSTGNRGVVVDSGKGVTLRRLKLADLGEGGIVFSGGERRTLTSAAHLVEECRIERFARLSRSYRPANRIEGVGVQMLRNRIDDGSHSAIFLSGNDHRIEGNHISNVVTETNDAGATYTGRYWTMRGTVIRNNLLQNIVPRLLGANSVKGIYLDNQASGTTISGNVFANVSRAEFIGGGRGNLVEHNLFVASSPAIFADNRGMTWPREQTSDAKSGLRTNLRKVLVEGELYRKRYPRLARVLSDKPGRSKYKRANSNLFVASRGFEFLDGAQLGMTQKGNSTQPWTVFKALPSPEASYTPQDFEFEPSALPPAVLAAFPPRREVAP